MLNNVRLTVIKLAHDPRTRAVFILGTLLVAALAGGAPEDYGG